MRVVRGLSAEESPLPEPELSLGNVVKLKQPYRVGHGQQVREFVFGVIAEHVGHNAWGHPVVSLYLYDADGRLFLGPNSIPEFVDFPAAEFVLWKVAAEPGYAVVNPPDGHDLYPVCSVCRGSPDQHPFKSDGGGPCPGCRGWGHVGEMNRLAGR